MLISGRGGNGRDHSAPEETLSGLSKAVESRIVFSARIGWWIAATVFACTSAVLATYYHSDARLTAAETKLQQHDIAIDSKESKEAADQREQRIMDRLDQMDKRWGDRWDEVGDEVKYLRAQREGRR